MVYTRMYETLFLCDTAYSLKDFHYSEKMKIYCGFYTSEQVKKLNFLTKNTHEDNNRLS